MSTNADDVLLGTTGAPVVKFPQENPGTIAKGTVLSKDVRQARDMDNKIKTFDDGSPKLEVIIVLQTDERDSSIENDDGKRRLIAGFEMQKAIGDAMRDADVRTLEKGGLLAVQHTHNEPPTKNGYSPTKKFRAQYQPPDPGGAANDLLTGASDAPAETPATSPAPAAAQPAPQPVGSLL